MNNRFDTYIQRVSKFYRNNKDYYHTIYHIQNLFNLFEYHENDFKKEFENDAFNPELICNNENILFWAIAFHDSFYIPGADYNEFISNLIYEREMRKEFISEQFIAVSDIIFSTIIGWADKDSNSLEKIMHDLDWSGFIVYKDCVENEKKILNEAVEISHYNAKDVIKNQIKFYQQFVDKDLYLTKSFNQYNYLVKENMRKRIDELSKQII